MDAIELNRYTFNSPKAASNRTLTVDFWVRLQKEVKPFYVKNAGTASILGNPVQKLINSVKTGDGSRYILWIVILAAAAIVITVYTRKSA